MIKLDDITVINDLRIRLEQITPEVIDSVERRDLSKPEKGEKVLATLRDDTTKALFALYMILRTESRLEAAQKDNALEELLRKDHAERSVVANGLSDAIKEIFWLTVRAETGLWTEPSIGMREGWQVVSCTQPDDKIRSLLSMLGGSEL